MRLFKDLIKLFILLCLLSFMIFLGYNFVVKIIRYYAQVSEAITTTGIIMLVAYIICKLLNVSFYDFLG